ncbi:glycosyltransferase [Prochlorococcus marinus]|uniref:glycosyltransferase n=1 Tax=Prochlorococcus marinus TaxID=1219 RepID=UPI001ADC9FDE|nr:glycosyltransferase [Prochlorococcus marinus]MBO8219534.1 glycosyltransferase [Prochlorococcus marinus CUG1416]MBW3051905.1 hypothetical protein [Prochlorococcus marinus str. MU1416]
MKTNVEFSIITVTLNAKAELLTTIKSVQEQNYKHYIHIIKDGFSNDKTNQIDYSKYRNTRFIESKDEGVYNAMNQGFKLSKNEYILFLNAGDIFLSKNSLRDLAENIKKNPNFTSYSGGTLQVNLKTKKIKRLIGLGILYQNLPFAQLPHPSFVVKKATLSKLNNPFDSRLKISADYKLQLELRKKQLWKNCYLNQIISIMPTGGISSLNKRSIIFGYKETLIFSYRLYNLISIYIILIKLILNLYSRLEILKLKTSNIHNNLFQRFFN